MNHEELLKDPQIQKLLRVFHAREELFIQGDLGKTLYVIVQGQVELRQQTGNIRRIVDIAGPGEILGEKAIILPTPYRRTLTATALAETVTLEISPAEWKAVLLKIPTFPIQMLRVVSLRLDRANETIAILMLKTDVERIAHYILFVARHFGTKSSRGIEFTPNMELMANETLSSESRVQECFDVLLNVGVVIKTGEGYLLTDEGALFAALPQLIDDLAA